MPFGVLLRPVQRHHRILVVDDDPSDIALLQATLGDGNEVSVARRGEEALAVLEAKALDAVLAAHLPDLSGIDVLHAAMNEQPRAARILLTDPSRVEDARDAVNLARVHRYLLKPLRPPEIEGAVRGAVNEVNLQYENERLVRILESTNARLERLVDDRTRELRQALEALANQAVRDGLTGLYNHRFFQEALDKAIATARRNGVAVGLLFIDVDHFKAYNDTFGHTAGDRLLREVAGLIAEGTGEEGGRASDIVARYGGEEFVRILPGTDRRGSMVVAERLRRRIEAHRFSATPAAGGDRITVSIGVAAWPEDAAERQALLDTADAALYEAKRSGRNQVRAGGRPLPGAQAPH